ncbi:hypothetical protein [Natronorarus salvus]|uniref:hypothetical protein n=1 Tax=Natronorarus salvus TaxID=3117733 RepID=UPI002F2688BB
MTSDRAVDELVIESTHEDCPSVERSSEEASVAERLHEPLPADDERFGSLFGTDPGFDEHVVKENPEEIVLLLVALRGSTHGTELVSDLTLCFDARRSPGTVYLCLHGLEEEGVLTVYNCVRTKEYSIADPERTRARLGARMRQQLLGLCFSACLGHRLIEDAAGTETSVF